MRDPRQPAAKFRRTCAAMAGSLGFHLGILVFALLFIFRQPIGGGESPQEISISLATLSPSVSTSAAQPSKSPALPETPSVKTVSDPQADAILQKSIAQTKSPPPEAKPDNSIEQPAHRSDSQAAPATNGAPSDDSMALIAMLLNQMKRCWVPPVEKPNPLTLSFRLSFNQDGTVATPPDLLDVIDDPYFRAAADATRRALYACAPFNLPQSRFNEWAEITNFSFDPSQMTTN